jgi:hypothetical protein
MVLVETNHSYTPPSLYPALETENPHFPDPEGRRIFSFSFCQLRYKSPAITTL